MYTIGIDFGTLSARALIVDTRDGSEVATAVGKEVVGVLLDRRSPGMLLQNHGVFALGTTPRDAVKAAVMCEDVARTSFLALQLGTPLPISPDDIAKLHHRYTHVYGQRDSA